MTIKKMLDLDLTNKRVLIRQDLNVPIKAGKITSDVRIQASIPTIQKALDGGAAVIIMSHLGRPTEGEFDESLSLQPVAERLSHLLGKRVRLVKDWLGGVRVNVGEVVLCENVRFNAGEHENRATLGQDIAALCDIFVMDAFGAAHRAQASTHSVAQFAPIACAGPLLVNELDALGKALKHAKKPLVAVVGGAKVSTKLTVLESLSTQVDQLIVGGGIANTFIAAAGFEVGKSLFEKERVASVKRLMAKTDIPIPVDVVCAKVFSENAVATIKNVADVADDDLILDIGPSTIKQYEAILKSAATIVWNGPVGVFEIEQFSKGTQSTAMAIANNTAFSIAGGGDTLAAIDKYGIQSKISYTSTGGGAFLEFLEGKVLPAVAILESK